MKTLPTQPSANAIQRNARAEIVPKSVPERYLQLVQELHSGAAVQSVAATSRWTPDSDHQLGRNAQRRARGRQFGRWHVGVGLLDAGAVRSDPALCTRAARADAVPLSRDMATTAIRRRRIKRCAHRRLAETRPVIFWYSLDFAKSVPLDEVAEKLLRRWPNDYSLCRAIRWRKMLTDEPADTASNPATTHSAPLAAIGAESALGKLSRKLTETQRPDRSVVHHGVIGSASLDGCAPLSYRAGHRRAFVSTSPPSGTACPDGLCQVFRAARNCTDSTARSINCRNFRK